MRSMRHGIRLFRPWHWVLWGAGAAAVWYLSGSAAAALVAAIFGLFPLLVFESGWRRSLEAAYAWALDFGKSAEILVTVPEECGRIPDLRYALQRMARRLQRRVAGLQREIADLELLLSDMEEGILTVDAEERVLRANRAALDILGVRRQFKAGAPMQEVLLDAGLQRLLKHTMQSGEAGEEELLLEREGQRRYLRVRASVLRQTDRRNGAVLVLSDVTRLQKLQTMRRDFVANVSHELKTPISAIRGAVETIRSDPGGLSPDMLNFLDIAARQSDRLNNIIEDLLNLSSLEHDPGAVQKQEQEIEPVLRSAVRSCLQLACEKNLSIEMRDCQGVQARINATLLEQALVNLISNALKYSESKSPVRIFVEQAEDRISIAVQDEGKGIEAAHQPRIFERFYRVDKARSRKAGGTGLGLAIVKHIAQLHGGQATLESEVGTGCTFRINLPAISSETRQPSKFEQPA